MSNKTSDSNQLGAESGLTFMSVEELYGLELPNISFTVDNLLASEGVSILAGKPKAGKSTLARQLAVAVAKGQPFLGRQTQQGKVLYLALEEKWSEVRGHLQQLGLTGEDPLLVRCGSVKAVGDAVEMLQSSLIKEQPALVIIDPLFRFIRVKDSNEYVPVTTALETIEILARTHKAHILCAHHMKKKETEDLLDGSLGSTAITGSCDTYLALTMHTRGQRALASRQRYGTDMEPTLLDWDSASRSLSLGVTCDEAERLNHDATRERIQGAMIEYVAKHPGSTQDAVFNAVRGKTTTKKEVFQAMQDEGLFAREGSGKKGEPYTYKLADAPEEVLSA